MPKQQRYHIHVVGGALASSLQGMSPPLFPPLPPPPLDALCNTHTAYMYINNTIKPPSQIHFYLSGRLIPSP